MIVIPAVMSILGDSAWKLPAWLDKILPNVDIEGEAIRRIPKRKYGSPLGLNNPFAKN